LGRPVSGDQAAGRLRIELHRDERTGTRDEPVEQHRFSEPSALQNHADKSGDLEAAKRGQDLEGIVQAFAIYLEAAPDHRALVTEPGFSDAGAAPDRQLRLDAC